MIPVIAIVGRPNVGKSTLFNRLTKSRDALVADMPGLTRDRKYGEATLAGRRFILIDTGGLGGEEEGVEGAMAKQTWTAVNEADVVLFMLDGRSGLSHSDQRVASELRNLNKKLWLVVNKIDSVDANVAVADFYQLGMGEPLAIAAAHGRGVNHLVETVLADIPASLVEEPELDLDVEPDENTPVKLAIVGRPNVGKSTLVNRMLGEERVVVFDLPGTTRDSIFISMERRGKPYTLIDTAGVRRRGKVTETVEKFSIIKTLQAIAEANVVIVLVDASEGITEQDLHLLGFVIESGRSLLIGVNKWDGLAPDQRDEVKRELDRRLSFIDYAKIHFISALHGSGVGDLFMTVDKAYASAVKRHSTPLLTRILERTVTAHPPPLVRGRRIKLSYAHAGGYNPPRVIIHGRQTDRLPDSYKRYLSNAYRKALRLVGTPIRIELKSSENPFAGRRQSLTPRQVHKRRRLMRHVKKK